MNKIKTIDVEYLKKIILSSNSMREVLLTIGVRAAGRNFYTLKSLLKSESIDFSHFKNKSHKEYIDDEIFVENSHVTRKTIKNRIIRDKLIEYKCAICNLPPLWNDKELVLILDHINGVHNDNRLNNLRFVCPNCDHQSDTFAGRNIEWEKKEVYCADCGEQITKYTKSSRCQACSSKFAAKYRLKAIDRPRGESLYKLVWLKPITHIAIEYGVSDKAVLKWCQRDGIKTPGPGYWNKKVFDSLK